MSKVLSGQLISDKVVHELNDWLLENVVKK